jgi:hypothetical protein
MKHVRLERLLFGPAGTFGKMAIDDTGFSCWTVERPGFPFVSENEAGLACIPAGEYAIKLGVFHRNTPTPVDDYPAYEVLNVPGRSLIKIHKANFPTDVKGCIGLGMNLGELNGHPAVLSSSGAYDAFMKVLANEANALLTIAARS